jgi:hypothetical protein
MNVTAWRWRRWISSAVASLAVITAISADAGTAPAAAFTANGTIYCNAPVVGVWVYAGGNSGWATYRPYGDTASYSKNIGWNVTYKLSVGCGGSPSRWATSNYEGSNLFEAWPWTVVCSGGACYASDVEVA